MISAPHLGVIQEPNGVLDWRACTSVIASVATGLDAKDSDPRLRLPTNNVHQATLRCSGIRVLPVEYIISDHPSSRSRSKISNMALRADCSVGRRSARRMAFTA